MDNSKNGGPAFPLQSIGPDFAPGYAGMTLRDYFIAHAPAEPHPWFEPVLPPKADSIPHFTVLYPDCTANEVKALRDYDDEYMAPDSVQEERVRNYLVHKESERKRDSEYGRMADRERYIQWPAAWADAMLAARDEQTTAAPDIELTLTAENQKRVEAEHQRDQLLAALDELVGQNDNGIAGVSAACWQRARAAVKGGA